MMAIHYNILNEKGSMSQLKYSKKRQGVGVGAREEGKLFFTEKCQVINVDGLMGLENLHFVTTKIITEKGRIINGC